MTLEQINEIKDKLAKLTHYEPVLFHLQQKLRDDRNEYERKLQDWFGDWQTDMCNKLGGHDKYDKLVNEFYQKQIENAFGRTYTFLPGGFHPLHKEAKLKLPHKKTEPKVITYKVDDLIAYIEANTPGALRDAKINEIFVDQNPYNEGKEAGYNLDVNDWQHLNNGHGYMVPSDICPYTDLHLKVFWLAGFQAGEDEYEKENQ